MKGRRAELATIAAALKAAAGVRLALVGSGGSGKSMLACAVGHQIARAFPGGAHWFRVGAWDHRTLVEMLARRLRIPRGEGGEELAQALRKTLVARGQTLIVLDNHESDRDMARFLDGLRDVRVTWLLTARRCLLSGVTIYPVVPPLVTSGRSAFPRVAELTRILRWHPLALDIADALVATGAITAPDLKRWLLDEGVEAVGVMDHEDDIAEVRLLVRWIWPRLPAGARRLLTVLGHSGGDDMDVTSLHALARVTPTDRGSLAALQRWRLVQEPLRDRYTLHAVIKHAVLKRTAFPPERFFQHYLRLLERHIDRLDLEQTHLFAAMDFAHRTSDLTGALRIERLLGTEPH